MKEKYLILGMRNGVMQVELSTSRSNTKEFYLTKQSSELKLIKKALAEVLEEEFSRSINSITYPSDTYRKIVETCGTICLTSIASETMEVVKEINDNVKIPGSFERFKEVVV